MKVYIPSAYFYLKYVYMCLCAWGVSVNCLHVSECTEDQIPWCEATNLDCYYAADLLQSTTASETEVGVQCRKDTEFFFEK